MLVGPFGTYKSIKSVSTAVDALADTRYHLGMAQDNLLRLKSSSGTMLYSRKNKKKLSGVKLSLKKYDAKLRKRVVFKEVKK